MFLGGPWARGGLLVGVGWEGLEPSDSYVSGSAVRLGLFGLPLEAQMGLVSQLVPMLAGLLMDCGWEVLEFIYRAT